MMERYKDLDHDSNILAFEIGSDYIIVVFKDNSSYLYNSTRPGINIVNQMKRLASVGEGLNSFIMKYVRKNYAQKLQ